MKKTRLFFRKKYAVLLLFILLLFYQATVGQTYLPFTATVYDSAATSGYYFFAPKLKHQPPTGNKDANMILDKYGDVVYYRSFPPGVRATDFKIQPNGLMTYSDIKQFYIMDSTFTLIDSVRPKNGLHFDGHDFQILPNGHFLFITNEWVQMDLSSYYLFAGNTLPGSDSAMVKCGVIQELDSAQNVVFEWHTKDYFAFDETDPHYLNNTEEVDWTHCNSVELDVDGNILLSTRQFNEITKINRSDSSIMWRWGGSQNQFTFINDTVQFRTQHDCRRIANGNITLFDNGYIWPTHPAEAREYQVDENLKTATLVWSYVHHPHRYSKSRGNVQRTTNGHTVVDYGYYENVNLVFSCVDSAGNNIMEVSFQDTCVSYRAFNYPVLPWNLNRPKITCEEIGGQVYLSVDSTIGSYIWSTGDTTYKIQVTGFDTFYVFVPIGSGGFIKSEIFIISTFSNPCQFTTINTPVESASFTLMPNPASQYLSLQTGEMKEPELFIRIIDMLGRQVYVKLETSKSRLQVPVEFLSPGLYYMEVNGIRKKFIKI